MKQARSKVFVVMFLLSLLGSSSGISSALAAPAVADDFPPIDEQAIWESYNRLPLYFEANQGQTDAPVRYLARGNGYSLFLTENQAVISMAMDAPDHAAEDGLGRQTGVYNLFMTFADANPQPMLTGEIPQAGVSSYFVGRPQNWHTDIAHYGRVRYQNLYDGIDAVFYGNPQHLQYDFQLAPYADPTQIRLEVAPADNLQLKSTGDLVLDMGGQRLTMQAPYSYQMVDGIQVPIESHFVISDGQLSFALGTYEPSLPLVIDPVLVYAGYLGGNSIDYAYGIAVDASGSAYIVGGTTSSETTFPVTVGPDLTWNGSFTGDAFVAKLNAAGSALAYAGYIGGAFGDIGYGIAVDASGNAYVTGQTGSDETTFPVTAGSFDDTFNGTSSAFGGDTDGFVAKVNPTGSALIYAGYLAQGSSGRGVAVNASGEAYVTGQSGGSGFVYEVNAAGSGFVYQWNIGGTIGNGIAIDSSGNAYVAGQSGSNALVVSVNAAGSGNNYSSTPGGSGTDVAYAIAVDSSGNAYVVGQTTSTNFPTAGTLDTSYGGGTGDGFIMKFSPAGGTVYSGYIGGSSFDAARGVAVDSIGNAYVTGNTSSTEASFPVASGPDLTYNNSGDAFVVLVDSGGTQFAYGGYIGGSSNDTGYAIALDSSNNAYIAGSAVSTEATFPDGDGFGGLTSSDNTYNGGFSDGFVAKVSFPLFVELSTATASGPEGDSGTSAVTTPTLLVSGGIASTALTIEIALTDGTAALADSDYSQTNITVTIPAGDYSSVTPISIPVATLGIVGDTTAETDEDLTLTLQNPGGGAVIGDANGDTTTTASTVYTIQNDDAAVGPTSEPTTAATAKTSHHTSGSATSIFDPAISKIGLLVPGQAGVTGEQLRWVITVTNNGSAAGNNVVVSDSINLNLRVNRVEAPQGITSDISGQEVTVTIPVLNAGETIAFNIFTTTLQGASVENTACLTADGYGTPLCATGTGISQLPDTGESPWSALRLPLLFGLAALSLLGLRVLLRRKAI